MSLAGTGEIFREANSVVMLVCLFNPAGRVGRKAHYGPGGQGGPRHPTDVACAVQPLAQGCCISSRGARGRIHTGSPTTRAAHPSRGGRRRRSGRSHGSRPGPLALGAHHLFEGQRAKYIIHVLVCIAIYTSMYCDVLRWNLVCMK